MAKLPTRSVTHEDIELNKLASFGMDVEEVADGTEVTIAALIELAEEQGRPVSHFLASIPLATDLTVAGGAPIAIKVCAGTCQRWGALDLLDALAARWEKVGGKTFSIVPVTCLDRCDQAPACELHGDHGALVIAPATVQALEDALATLAAGSV